MEELKLFGYIILGIVVLWIFIEFWPILLAIAGLILIYFLFFRKKVKAKLDIRHAEKVASQLSEDEKSTIDSVILFLKGCIELVNTRRDLIYRFCTIKFHEEEAGGCYFSASMELYDGYKNFLDYFYDVMETPFTDAESYSSNPSALANKLYDELVYFKFGRFIGFEQSLFDEGDLKIFTWFIKPYEMQVLDYLTYVKSRCKEELANATVTTSKKNRLVLFVNF